MKQLNKMIIVIGIIMAFILIILGIVHHHQNIPYNKFKFKLETYQDCGIDMCSMIALFFNLFLPPFL